jgi:hypothetical protein
MLASLTLVEREALTVLNYCSLSSTGRATAEKNVKHDRHIAHELK